MKALMAVGAGMLMQQATKAMLSDAKSETAEDRAISNSHIQSVFINQSQVQRS